jgi:hypothetical protein
MPQLAPRRAVPGFRGRLEQEMLHKRQGRQAEAAQRRVKRGALANTARITKLQVLAVSGSSRAACMTYLRALAELLHVTARRVTLSLKGRAAGKGE